MSSAYVSEPPTKGKVIMTTTYGPLDIELWPKEAPKAVRNFVQLCLEGYFDNTNFHRVIPGFLVQGGDPTGSGTGGESIYGSAFSDEFHSRLRFTHRGLVACANAGCPNSNGSQFFITLDKCDWLDKQNTIFGKVTGDSIFNLLELGKVETDKNDRPLEPIPVVKSVEVLWNPFEDIVPRILTKPSAAETEQKTAKQKVVKNLNLLSFGEEAEEEEKVLSKVHHKIKSSHDVLNDPRLLKEDTNEADPKATRDLQLSVREALSSKKVEPYKNEVVDDEDDTDTDNDNDDEETFDNKMRKKIIEKQKKLGGAIPSLKEKADKDTEVDSDSESEEESKGKVEKLSLKKKGIGSEARAERMINADVDLQLYGEAERTRLLHKQKKRRLQGREEDVLAKLENFRKNLTHLPLPAPAPALASVSDSGENEDVSDWTATGLVFSREVGKDAMARREAADDYVVHDPLLEKGKEKFNKMQAKEKRRQREWAGRSLT